jgi:hypothetical protein
MINLLSKDISARDVLNSRSLRSIEIEPHQTLSGWPRSRF